MATEQAPRPQVPESMLYGWQGIVDLLASALSIPAGLIVKASPPQVEVLVASSTDGNPYARGERSNLGTGQWWETVMALRSPLLVPNALKDPHGEHNPLLERGMVSFWGSPVCWPNGEVFGAICAMDVKENPFGDGRQGLLQQLGAVLETDLHHLCQSHRLERRLEKEAVRYQRLEARLAEMKRPMERAVREERLRALTAIAGGVAHDLGNAIVPILGYSELLLAHPEILDDRERASRYLQSITTAATYAESIVGRLQELNRPPGDTEPMQLLDLNGLVEETVSLARARWSYVAQGKGKDVQVRTELATGLPRVRGSGAGLRIALVDLALNAVEAMPRGGTLTVRTRQQRSNVLVEVTDTGVGMSDEVRKRAFEMFFTTKDRGGTGIGLTVVDRIVHRHGGRVKIESRLGAGTTVAIYLPVPLSLPPEVEPPALEGYAAEGVPGRRAMAPPRRDQR